MSCVLHRSMGAASQVDLAPVGDARWVQYDTPRRVREHGRDATHVACVNPARRAQGRDALSMNPAVAGSLPCVLITSRCS